jgi:hypothetical protein
VVYHTGQAVVVRDVDSGSKEFLFIREKTPIVEEISMMEISQDG